LNNLTNYAFKFGATPMVVAGYVMVSAFAAICGYGMYVGYALWTIRPNAVKHSKRFLLSLLLLPLFADMFVLFMGQAVPNMQDLAVNMVGETLKSLFVFGILLIVFAAYLDCSGRVANTYR
jgi:uncharacterized membrane protein